MYLCSFFGKECNFVPKVKLYVYNKRNNKRKYEVLYTQVTLPIHTVRMGYPSVRDIVDGINKDRILNLLPNQTWITLQNFGDVTLDLSLEKQLAKLPTQWSSNNRNL